MNTTTSDAPKARILVIDDDVFISGLYGEMLSRANYAITYARNGVEGLKVASEEAHDLILLDVVMPEMDGFETLSRLKAGAKTKDIPVIMLTSMSQQPDVERGLAEGAVAYLAKTKVIPSEAMAVIEKTLREQKKPAVKRTRTRKK